MKITASILARKEAELRDAKCRASLAYSNMCQARADIESAKEEILGCFKEALRVQDEYKALWARYTKIKRTCGQKIQAQNEICRSEHKEMNKFLRWSESALVYDDIEDHERCQQEARICREKRDRAASKVARYIKFIRVAREFVSASEANIITRKYCDAKKKFRDAENRYGINHEDFYNFEAKSEQLAVELKQMKKDYGKRKKALKKQKESEYRLRTDIMEASGINEAFYGNAKIKFRVERGVNTYHIYYNAVDKPDGDHHGHSVVEEIDGELSERYHRPPLSEHGRQNLVAPPKDQPETSG